MRAAHWLLAGGSLLAAAACGATAPGGGSPAVDPDDPRALTEEAALAWRALDPESAARSAERAVAAGGGTDALEIAARANLALGRYDDAIDALERATSPHLRRLRARAQIGRGDFEAAARTLEGDDDPWAESIRPALAAMGARRAYRVRGERAEVALEDLPLPVVRVRVDAVETLALIGSGAAETVLDPSVRATAGAIDALRVGDLRIGPVPHTVRSLEAVREALGAPIGAVLGLDLLMRLHARLDGPGRRITLLTEPEPVPADATTTAFITPTGSFLAVEARLEDRAVWLTVDTAGIFPIALAPGVDAALGLEARDWQASDAGPSLVVLSAIRVGSLSIEELPVIRGVLDEHHARAVGAPVAGSLGWGLLGQLVVRFDPDGRRLVFE